MLLFVIFKQNKFNLSEYYSSYDCGLYISSFNVVGQKNNTEVVYRINKQRKVYSLPIFAKAESLLIKIDHSQLITLNVKKSTV